MAASFTPTRGTKCWAPATFKTARARFISRIGVFALKKSAPKHLTPEAADWWQRLTKEYDLGDDAGRLLLQTALEAFDRMRSCQAAVRRDGEMVKDRFEQLKPHPLLA
ncbi:MAG TPA: hypothetical protein VFL54_06750, partial [Gammaproteobacteria bacterium]|nr:hypothetical protein [Gammaproteobacteria bacterium]